MRRKRGEGYKKERMRDSKVEEVGGKEVENKIEKEGRHRPRETREERERGTTNNRC